MSERILVIGAGGFGSCLADHLGSSHPHQVFLYSRSEEVVEAFNRTHKNIKYLKDHAFSSRITAVGPLLPDREFIQATEIIVFAIPTQSLRAILRQLDLTNVSPLPLLVFVNKGIEIGTNQLPLEVIAETCSEEIARVSCFLSGPSFAAEIVKRQPTQVSVASLSIPHAEAAAKVFHQPHFRCYVNADPIGVELAGALKNIYAIASGVATGLGFEANTRAGLVTRSLAEMMRIGVAYGANPLTFLSLAGVGDLFLTTSSEKSRNFTVGFRLGRGETLEHILATLGSVAEGVDTAKAAYSMITEKKIKAPILEHVYQLLWQGGTAVELARALMELPMMSENDSV